MVAVGARAEWITADHPLQYGYGPDSPLGKLCDADGYVLQIGVSPGTATIIHLAEHMASVPNKRQFTYRAPIRGSAGAHWVTIEEYDTASTVVECGHDYFDDIGTGLRSTGLGTVSTVGHAAAFLCRAADFRDYAVKWLEMRFGESGGSPTSVWSSRALL